MSRYVHLTKPEVAITLGLERSHILAGLSLDKLRLIAKRCDLKEVSSNHAEGTLDLSGQVAFVAEGTFEDLFCKEGEFLQNPDAVLALEHLEPGAMWGEHFLLPSPPAELKEFGLRCVGKGLLITLPAIVLEKYMRAWPALRDALLEAMLERHTRQKALWGAAEYGLRRWDKTLNRLDSALTRLEDDHWSARFEAAVSRLERLTPRLAERPNRGVAEETSNPSEEPSPPAVPQDDPDHQ